MTCPARETALSGSQRRGGGGGDDTDDDDPDEYGKDDMNIVILMTKMMKMFLVIVIVGMTFLMFRKNPGVWETWHPGRGNARHSLQLAIARRGVELLKEGGLMAYSSCALNQV